MNHIDILTCQPEILDSPFNNSIIKIAQEKNLVSIKVHNLRDYTENKHRKVDHSPFGGGGGMILKIEPVYNSIEELKKKKEIDEIIYMSADGEKLNQKTSNQLSLLKNIIIICGHYKGIDERIMKFYAREVFWQKFLSAWPGGSSCVNICQVNLEKQIKNIHRLLYRKL